jgi:hypothetical protein
MTGDETWMSFVNVETKEKSKHCMRTLSPNRPKKFNQTISLCQETDGNCFLEQERSPDGGINAKSDYNNVTSLLRNTKKNCVRLVMQSKRRGMLTYSVLVVLPHDNARPH